MAVNGISILPNILSPDTDKDSQEFGLKFMSGAYENWNTGYNGETRWGRKARFDYNRSFAMGRQPMQEYKDILDLDGELSVIQLIYEPLPIAIPFIQRLKDRYNQRTEKIQCNSVDPFTSEKKKGEKDNAVFKLQERERIQALQQSAGVEIAKYDDSDPQSIEEINVTFGYNFKVGEEIIMQELINIVLYDNDWSGVLKDRIMDDLICCGYAGVRVYIDGTGRIKIRFIRPENLITSYSEWNDFRDWQYQGEVYYLSIAEVRLKYPGKLTEKQLFDLATECLGKYGNPTDFSFGWDISYTTALARPYDGFRVEITELSLKTLYNLKRRKESVGYGREKLYPIEPGERVPDAKIDKSPPYYVEYGGCMISETTHVLEWGLSRNMVKPDQNLQEILSPYIVYMYGNTQMVNKPMMETMIPSIKMMQMIDLKKQAIIAAAMPDGYDVAIDEMSDIDIGLGGESLSPFEVYKIKKQTGVGFYKRGEDNGDGKRGEPITPNNVPFSGKLEQLGQEWNAEFDKLYRITGSNSLESGEIKNQAVGKAVLQDAKQIGESASNYIYNSYLNIMQRMAKIVQLRGWDILVYGKKFGIVSYEGYRQALGSNKVEYLKLEAPDGFEKTNFDVQIKPIIDDSEQQFLERNIELAMQNGTIDLNDALDCQKLAEIDVDYASYMLASRIARHKKEIVAENKANSEANTQSAIAAAQAKSQGELQLETVKAEFKAKQTQMEAENARELEVLKSLGLIKAEIARSFLQQPGAKWQDLPPSILDGVGIVDQTEKQLMVHAIHQGQDEMAQEAQAQQMEQQQLAQAQAQQQQPGQVEQGQQAA